MKWKEKCCISDWRSLYFLEAGAYYFLHSDESNAGAWKFEIRQEHLGCSGRAVAGLSLGRLRHPGILEPTWRPGDKDKPLPIHRCLRYFPLKILTCHQCTVSTCIDMLLVMRAIPTPSTELIKYRIRLRLVCASMLHLCMWRLP